MHIRACPSASSIAALCDCCGPGWADTRSEVLGRRDGGDDTEGDGDFDLREDVGFRPSWPWYVDVEYTERDCDTLLFSRSASIVRYVYFWRS
jgi:hypothetical protein